MIAGTIDEIRGQLHAAVPIGAPEVRESVVDLLLLELELEQQKPADGDRGIHRRLGNSGYYAVREGELDLDWLSLACTAAFALVTPPVSAIVPPLVILLFRLRKAGVDLSTEQAAVLQLMSHPRKWWAAPDLALRAPFAITNLQMEALLSDLLEARKRNGDRAELLERSDSLWRSRVD